MATKSAIEKRDDRPGRQEPSALANFSGNAVGTWTGFTRFLSDVRAEMRKVVTPTRKEVEATTGVVLVTVFLFGFYFFVVDFIFNRSLQALLHRLGAQ